jgi:hypothetical protein
MNEAVNSAANPRNAADLLVVGEGGCEFAFPVALAEGLADAPRSKLRKIKISPNGLGLHWPLLDADLYVPGLIEGAFGSRRWMQQMGKLGGQAAVRSRRRPPVRTASAAVVPKRKRPLSATPGLSRLLK